MKIRIINTWDERQSKWRIVSVYWKKQRRMLSISWWNRIIHWARIKGYSWQLTIIGVRVHYKYGGGGLFV